MTEDGQYPGGPIPSGYTLVYNGRKNKKGQDMRDYAVDTYEAEAVRKI